MSFKARNLYYLRLSVDLVLPLYLYLDDRHIDWMTNRTLQKVISDLRPLIPLKLDAEKNAHFGPGGPANAKRATVDVHRGDHYQFAYFLRKSESHTIVLKTRNYAMLPPKPKPSVLVGTRSDRKRKRSEPVDETLPSISKVTKKNNNGGSSLREKVKKTGRGKATEVIEDSEEEAEESPLSSPDGEEAVSQVRRVQPRRSTRGKKYVTRENQEDSEEGNAEEDVQQEGDLAAENDVQFPGSALDDSKESFEESHTEQPFKLSIDEEEEKPKPVLQLNFKALRMRDRYVCVVVEPWPALPTNETARASSIVPPSRQLREPSIAPPDFVASVSERDPTPLPLFLPDFDRGRSITPAPVRFPSVFSGLQTMGEMQDLIEDDENFGILEFSQALNAVSGDRTGGLDEDDEMDGSILYGDADEVREIVQ